MLVKALYQWQLAEHDLAELERQFEGDEDFVRIDRPYFRQLLAFAIDGAEVYDKLIGKYAARGVDQLDAIGRGILLMALAELQHRHDVPIKVVINEAVELAKRYGAAESYRFVNAVLDKASRSSQLRSS